MKIYYDLHIHSALSACADEDMTPNDIVNMAVLKGLDVIAVADHNSCRNCRAVMEVARGTGILVIPAMELQTSEDVHILCLFRDIANAERFSEYVYKGMLKVLNNERIFGTQYVLDATDRVVDIERFLYTVASNIGVYQVVELLKRYGGFAIPAHVDRENNGLLSILGYLDAEMGFKVVEINKNKRAAERPDLKGIGIVTNSDAHNLWSISEATNFVEMDAPIDIDNFLTTLGGLYGHKN
jgi:PHP family Zn ribbon phosphoesterase